MLASQHPASLRQASCSCRAAHDAPRAPVLTKRAVLAGWVAGAALSPPAAAQAASPSSEGLAARATTDMVLRSPGNSLFGKPGTIFFPRWMFGQWEVRARYASFRAPLGDAFVPPPILRAARATPAAGGVGSEYAYSARWFSTLPNTWSNNTKVWLGLGVPNDAVVPDRAYNLRSLTNAAAGWECVASVTYDPRDAPDRQTVEFARLTPDMQPLPPRKAEVYINNSRFAEEAPDVFVTSELFRQVMLRVRAIDVSDYEVITVYRLFAPGHVSAVQRTAVYLDPREPRYFEAGGRAVAVTDTLLDMVRDPAPVDAVGADACVLTPKDVVQCV